MKKLILLITLIVTSISAYCQNSAEAKALLDEVSAKVKNYTNIQLEFIHKLDNEDADVHQETRGNVTIEGDLYHLNYMGTEQIFDGKKVYLIIHEDEEVIIQNPSNSDEEALTPSKMFSFYKTGYSFAMDELKTIKGIKIQYVKLTPINSRSEVATILVGIDVNTKHIYNIIETGDNNTITTLQVTSFKTNQAVPVKLFTFDLDKYKNQKNYTISEPNN
jgi:outer membrane lipoprotein-sorting protein